MEILQFRQVHRCVRKDSGEEYAVKIIDKTSLSSHEKFLLRGEIGAAVTTIWVLKIILGMKGYGEVFAQLFSVRKVG